MRTLAQWLALQESVHPKSIDLGLERVTAVARRLQIHDPACPVITVGGTNGKGSTVAHLEALLQTSGARTGLFTSPHFVRYNERIRVDGAEVQDAELLEAFEQIEQARGSATLTFFEYNTLAALWIFRARAVDVAILEVGLGGRLDATNLVDADVCIVCSIGFDHRDWLGDTLELIGAEKAGIFRNGRPAVLSTPDMPASVYAAIETIGARAVLAERDFSWTVQAGSQRSGHWSYNGLKLRLTNLPASALAGSIQYRNASAALAALESLPGAPVLSESSVSAALRSVRLAGRFQIVPGEIEWILDIAHNEPAARVFAGHLSEHPASPGGRTFAIVGILGDKDATAIVRALAPQVDHWILCSLPGPRGIASSDLARRVALTPDQIALAGSVMEGCELAKTLARAGDRVIVFGSVLTVGPALQWLQIY